MIYRVHTCVCVYVQCLVARIVISACIIVCIRRVYVLRCSLFVNWRIFNMIYRVHTCVCVCVYVLWAAYFPNDDLPYRILIAVLRYGNARQNSRSGGREPHRPKDFESKAKAYRKPTDNTWVFTTSSNCVRCRTHKGSTHPDSHKSYWRISNMIYRVHTCVCVCTCCGLLISLTMVYHLGFLLYFL